MRYCGLGGRKGEEETAERGETALIYLPTHSALSLIVSSSFPGKQIVELHCDRRFELRCYIVPDGGVDVADWPAQDFRCSGRTSAGSGRKLCRWRGHAILCAKTRWRAAVCSRQVRLRVCGRLSGYSKRFGRRCSTPPRESCHLQIIVLWSHRKVCLSQRASRGSRSETSLAHVSTVEQRSCGQVLCITFMLPWWASLVVWLP